MKRLKLLGMHGLGDHRDSSWKEDWEKAVRAQFPARPDLHLEFDFLSYDQLFESVDISTWEALRAIGKLLSSGIGGIFRGARRGLVADTRHFLRWYAGYVVAWVEDKEFRRRTRALVLEKLKELKPDVLMAHSLGSLLSYDALSHEDAQKLAVRDAVRKLHYVTLGSQIANPFVVANLTPGRIAPLDVKRWTHLWNPEDAVFTAPIRLPEATNFRQIETYFDDPGPSDHAATSYLAHASAKALLWSPLAADAGVKSFRAFAPPSPVVPARKRAQAAPKGPVRRALLVGINEYPDPKDRLDGCVNDVFFMSSVLQECGFAAEEIRVCLNERATARGIVERLEWLLRDPQPQDELVFYYSGHGAQLATYGESERVDRKDETLVPYDFDWSPETSITDDRIFELYSQIPYDTRLAMIFDCCHSGGIHRAGVPRARGLNPPDDIRHRELRWNPALEMWEERELRALRGDFSRAEAVERAYFGSSGCVARLGRASALRKMSRAEYEARKRRAGGEPVGPYLPLLLEACAEKELAYEYRHGVTSYGAFTFALASRLRRTGKVTFRTLVEGVGAQLEALGYEQMPQVLGPKALLDKEVPWRVSTVKSRTRAPKSQVPKGRKRTAKR